MKLIHLTESVDVTLGANQEEIAYKAKKLVESKGGVVIPTIEAIHSKVTRNRTFYGPNRLKGKPDYIQKETGEKRPSGVYSWTDPFNRPMLINHDILVDPLGRIVKAEYKQRTSAGIPGIIIYPEITDPDAAIKVLDGRYSTVSIGADTDAAYCSICKKNQVIEWCDHRRGQVYDGKLCYWSMGELWFGECSFVNAPSDEFAGVKEIPDAKESTLVDMSLLIQDLREHKMYDLSKDELYAITNKGLVLIPRTEYMQEYFYVPFNIKIDEESVQEDTQRRITDLTVKDEKVLDTQEATEEVVEMAEDITVESEEAVEDTNTSEEAEVAEETQEVEESESGTEAPVGEANVEEPNAFAEKVIAIAKELGILSETSDRSEDIKALEDKIVELQDAIDALTTENQALTAQITELKAANLHGLVEQVVKRKVELGDISEADVEAETARLVSRSEESLRDTLDDLAHRKPALPRQIERVENPGLVENDEEGTITNISQEDEEEAPELNLTPQEVFKRLLTKKDIPQTKRGGK